MNLHYEPFTNDRNAFGSFQQLFLSPFQQLFSMNHHYEPFTNDRIKYGSFQQLFLRPFQCFMNLVKEQFTIDREFFPTAISETFATVMFNELY
jgi:hypothetical protein